MRVAQRVVGAQHGGRWMATTSLAVARRGGEALKCFRTPSCCSPTTRAASRTLVTERRDSTHFGFRDVLVSEKANLVRDVFERVASDYDRMNDFMSLGLHRVWKDDFVKMLGPRRGTRIVDLAGGTGDISFRIVRAMADTPANGADDSHVLVVDVNGAMLEQGKKRAASQGAFTGITLDWLEADAEQLPIPDNSVDAVTMAFGLRNCTNPSRVIEEAQRILVKGGRFMCLEFSKVENPVFAQVYDMFSFGLIPQIGAVVAKDADAYQYLVESIRKFWGPEEMCLKMREAGLQNVDYTRFMNGICAVHSGFKLS